MKKHEKFAFFTILLIGFFTRFFNFSDIPFTNDELSALNRLNFSSFSELIQKAVYTDGHPAGVQSFLWCYTKLFGTQQSIVKLPFIILGFLSLPLYFFAAKNLTNTKTALITMAFLATLQYPIFYSQTIRPYSSGQFLTALSIFLWSLRLKHHLSYLNPINYIFAISIFLSLSNHYFNAFAVILLVPPGFLLSNSKSITYHLFPYFVALLLYIPQYSIFAHQLSVGSPGWLPIPNFESLIKHFQYEFQFSNAPFLIIFGYLIFVIITKTFPKSQIKRSIIWLCLYLIPILTAYFYSIYRAPIFQDSIFIFSFFFLFLFLGDILLTNKTNPIAFYIFLGAILTSNLYSLVIKRQHYTQFYNHGYAKLVRDVKLFKDPKTQVHIFGFEPFFYNYNANQIQFDAENLHFHRDLFFADSAKNKSLLNRTFYNYSDSQLMIATAIEIPYRIIDILEFYYPYSVRSLYFGSEVYLFSKSPGIFSKLKHSEYQNTKLNPTHLVLNEKNVPHEIKSIEIPNKSKKQLPYLTNEPYIENHSIEIKNLKSLIQEKILLHGLFKISASLKSLQSINMSDTLDPQKLNLICQVTNEKDETIYFMHQRFEQNSYIPNQFGALLFLNFNYFECPANGKISCFIENLDKQTLQISNHINLKFIEGNPNTYSLTNDF